MLFIRPVTFVPPAILAGPVVYVLDASRSVPVCQALVNKDLKQRESYIEDIREQYAELREEFYAGLEDRKYLTLAAAQVGARREEMSDSIICLLYRHMHSHRTALADVLSVAVLSAPLPQAKALKVDWKDPINRPVTPKLLGTKAILEFPIQDLLEYIDWNPFFQVREWDRCGTILCCTGSGGGQVRETNVLQNGAAGLLT